MIATPSITAIGPLAAQLQEPIHRIRAAINALGIQPAMLINGVPHFSEADVNSIADQLRQLREQQAQPGKEAKQCTPRQ